MSARTWKDQPSLLEHLEVLARIRCNAGAVEVRGPVRDEDYVHVEDAYYVTVGGLFGSQTLKCWGGAAAFRAVDAVAHANTETKLSPPTGCELIEEAL